MTAPDLPIRFGIIGVGRIAVDAHLPCLRQAGAEVLALADVVPGRAARFAKELGVPHAFDDYRALLALPGLDAVSICSPIHAHQENALAAFAAGKHVFMEKPPAWDAAQMERITAAGRQAGKLLWVGSHSVYHQEIQELRRLIKRGELGEIYFAHIRECERWGLPHGWIRKKKFARGGPGIDGNGHILDRLLFLLGTPEPDSMTARAFYIFGRWPSTSPYLPMDYAEGREGDEAEDVEDGVAYLLQFKNGCTALVEASKTAHQEDFGGTWIYGDKGGARLRPLTVYTRSEHGALATTTFRETKEPQTHVQAFRHFLQCLRENRKQTDSPGERALVVMRIIDALYASAEQGGRQIRFER
jgi:predicted dehydrogenase